MIDGVGVSCYFDFFLSQYVVNLIVCPHYWPAFPALYHVGDTGKKPFGVDTFERIDCSSLPSKMLVLCNYKVN